MSLRVNAREFPFFSFLLTQQFVLSHDNHITIVISKFSNRTKIRCTVIFIVILTYYSDIMDVLLFVFSHPTMPKLVLAMKADLDGVSLLSLEKDAVLLIKVSCSICKHQAEGVALDVNT